MRLLVVWFSSLLALSSSARGAEAVWRYEVQAGERARELTIEATLASSPTKELSVDEGAEPFIKDVELEDHGSWKRLQPKQGSWYAAACTSGCRLRYRVELGHCADRLGNETAARENAIIQAPPSTFLLHPTDAMEGRDYRFHVRTPAGLTFVSGVHLAPDGAADTYQADTGDLPEAPYSAFGPFTVEKIERLGGRVDLALPRGRRGLADADVRAWVTNAMEAVGRYYGHFPIQRVLILVSPTVGSDAHGRTLGNGGATVWLSAGEEMTLGEMKDDWVVTHEMVHLALPSMPRSNAWLEEGLATYVEPLARARVGQLAPAAVWGSMIDGMPQGASSRHGLDGTREWGRIYWGGALFCLLADLEIREQSGNKLSLDTALRGIVDAGGTLEARWPLEKALAVGDRALVQAGGKPVLVPLHARMGPRPMAVDLDGMWRRLGLRVNGRSISFDDTAPLATVRRAMTTAK